MALTDSIKGFPISMSFATSGLDPSLTNYPKKLHEGFLQPTPPPQKRSSLSDPTSDDNNCLRHYHIQALHRLPTHKSLVGHNPLRDGGSPMIECARFDCIFYIQFQLSNSGQDSKKIKANIPTLRGHLRGCGSTITQRKQYRDSVLKPSGPITPVDTPPLWPSDASRTSSNLLLYRVCKDMCVWCEPGGHQLGSVTSCGLARKS
nr:hypothetical protein [Tanacetum cinerariifolium]